MLPDGIYDRGKGKGHWLRIYNTKGWYLYLLEDDLDEVSDRISCGWNQENVCEEERKALRFLIPMEYFK